MTDDSSDSKRVLDPNARLSEALFGLIMTLTFTGSLSVADSGRDDVRTMLIGALGCNLAWGIIDGIFYLMGSLGEQGQDLRALRSLQKAGTPGAAQRVLAEHLPPMVASHPHLQRHRHRAFVPDRCCIRTDRRLSHLADRPGDGSAR